MSEDVYEYTRGVGWSLATVPVMEETWHGVTLRCEMRKPEPGERYYILDGNDLNWLFKIMRNHTAYYQLSERLGGLRYPDSYITESNRSDYAVFVYQGPAL